MPKPQTVVRSIRATPELWARLSRHAERLGQSVNALAVEYLTSCIEGDDEDERDKARLRAAAEDFTTPAKVQATMRILPMSPPPSHTATFGPVRPAPGTRLKAKTGKGARAPT